MIYQVHVELMAIAFHLFQQKYDEMVKHSSCGLFLLLLDSQLCVSL